MTAETQRDMIRVVRRVVFSCLILLLAWLVLLGLRGVISPDIINLMNAERAASGGTGQPALSPLPLNPWSWDWSRSLWSGKTVAEVVGSRLGVTLRLMALVGVFSLGLSGLLLFLGMLISRVTLRPKWLARLRQALRLVVVSLGTSLPIFAVSTFLTVYLMVWFRLGETNPSPAGPFLWFGSTILSLLPAWLLVQYGHGELAKRPPGASLFDGVFWRNLGAKLIIRLLKLVGAMVVLTVLLEQTAAQPGLGRQFVDAVNRRDFPILFGIAWTYALIVVLVKLIADATEIGYRHLTRRSVQTEPAGAATTSVFRIPRWLVIAPMALAGVSLIVAFAAPQLAPYGYNEMVLGARLAPPSSQYILGTDNLGRDLLSRIIYGVRQDIFISLSAVAIIFVVAVAWSWLAAHVRRRNDWQGDTMEDLVMLPRDVLLAFPWLVLLLFLASLGAMTMGVSGQMRVTFLSLPPVLAVSFVLLPRAIGMMQDTYNASPEGVGKLKALLLSTAVMLVFAVAGGIIYLSSATYMGLGVPPPAPELGGLLAGPARRYMLQGPWMALWPSLALTSLVLVWVMAGEALLERMGFKSKAVWSRVWE